MYVCMYVCMYKLCIYNIYKGLYQSRLSTTNHALLLIAPATTAVYSLELVQQSKSKSKLLYDWRFTANQFVLASSPLRPTTTFFFN
jgi:hypothetical protein